MRIEFPLLVLLVGASMGAVDGRAMAAEEGAPKYSIEDVTACSADAMRLCKRNMPSIKAIESCMRAHYDQLRPKCQARFKR